MARGFGGFLEGVVDPLIFTDFLKNVNGEFVEFSYCPDGVMI